jgi:ABC-type branched-subunit amino acid transport system ATPase component
MHVGFGQEYDPQLSTTQPVAVMHEGTVIAVVTPEEIQANK